MILERMIRYPETNSIEATWIDESGVQVKCHSYSQAQMDLLAADLGADAPSYSSLIAEVIANAIPDHVRSDSEILASLTAQIQERLDNFARTRNYDGILSACTYATSTVPKFATEGQYCVQARDATWAAGYALMDEVLAGTRPVPSSIADIEADLPVLAWPA